MATKKNPFQVKGNTSIAVRDIRRSFSIPRKRGLYLVKVSTVYAMFSPTIIGAISEASKLCKNSNELAYCAYYIGRYYEKEITKHNAKT